MSRTSRSFLSMAFLASLLVAGCNNSNDLFDGLDSDPDQPTEPPGPDAIPLLDWDWFSDARVIDTDESDAGRVNGVIAATGDATLIWRREGTAPLSCAATTYFEITTTSWEGWAADLVECGDSDPGELPQVGMDSDGKAIVAWVNDQVGSDAAVRSAYRPADGDWSAAGDVSVSGGSGFESNHPSLFVPQTGDAYMVWQQRTTSSYGSFDNLYLSVFDTEANTWSVPTGLNGSGSGSGPLGDYYHRHLNPVLAGNQNGQMVLAYTVQQGYVGGDQYDIDDQVRAVIYTPDAAGDQWISPMRLSEGTNRPFNLRAVIDGDGNAIVLWLQNDGTVENLYGRRYDAVDGWDAEPTLLESGAARVIEMDAAIDGNGDVMVAWRQFIEDPVPSAQVADPEGYTSRLQYSRYDSETGSWSAPAGIHADSVEALAVSVDVDVWGNALVAWEGGQGYEISASRYEQATDTWRAPELLSTDFRDDLDPAYGRVDDVMVFVNDEGYAGVGWQQHNGTSRRIYATGLRDEVRF